MVKLYRRDVLEPVAHERLQLGIAGRHKLPVHQRKAVVDEAGIEPGDKPAGEDRQADEGDNPLGGTPPDRAASYSLSAPGGGEGWGEAGDSRAPAAGHLALPPPLRGAPPLPPQGGGGGFFARPR